MIPRFVGDRLDPAQRFGLRETLGLVALFLVAVPFGLLLRQVAGDGPLTEVDVSVAEALHRWFGDSVFLGLMRVVTTLGAVLWVYALMTAVCAFLWRRGRRRLAAYVAVTAIFGGVLNYSLKLTVGRPRPFFDAPLAEALGHSFPSGHTVLSTVLYGAILLVFLPAIPPQRRLLATAGTCALILLVGFSRMALGVHFLTDVLAGLVIGSAWLAASTAAFELWRREEGDRVTRPLVEGVEPEAAHDLRAADRGR